MKGLIRKLRRWVRGPDELPPESLEAMWEGAWGW